MTLRYTEDQRLLADSAGDFLAARSPVGAQRRLRDSGTPLGFDEAGARRLAIDTVLGAARLAASSEDSPAVLRQKVTSKGGTTEAALASLAAPGWHDELVAAVKAAEARGRGLGEQLGASE